MQVLPPQRVGLPPTQQEPGGRAALPESHPSALRCPGVLPSEKGCGQQLQHSLCCSEMGGAGGLLPARKTTKTDPKGREAWGLWQAVKEEVWLAGGGAQGGPRGQKEESSRTERAGPHDQAAVRGRDCRSLSLRLIFLAGGFLSAVWSTHALRGKTPASQEPAQGPPASETRTSGAPASLLPDQSGWCRPERALGVGPAQGNLVSPCPHQGWIPQSPTSPDARASFQTLAGHSAGGGGKGRAEDILERGAICPLGGVGTKLVQRGGGHLSLSLQIRELGRWGVGQDRDIGSQGAVGLAKGPGMKLCPPEPKLPE